MAPEKRTLRFARGVVRWRHPIAAALAAATLFFLYPMLNAVSTAAGRPLPGPVLGIGSDARDLQPDHPFIHAQEKFAGVFGNSTLIAIAVVREDGSIFTPDMLARIDRITKSLDGDDFDPRTDERKALRDELDQRGVPLDEIRAELDRAFPPYPVNHDQIRSLTHFTTRVVDRDPDGRIEINLLMDDLPETQTEADAVRKTVFERTPELLGRLVSRDESAALITAGFVTDRLRSPAIFGAVFEHLRALEEREEAEGIELHVVGAPLIAGWVLHHAHEIAWSVLGAIALIFVLLWAYFRRAHGVFIPLVCATVTVIWGTGFAAWMGIALDPLVLVIPMVITARAVSHTVQMAERFFEDYERLYPRYEDAALAKREAAAVAMGELIVPGTLGIVTDVAGLLVILVTTLVAMWNLGVFGAFWVASIVFTVEILHPILICALPPPREHRHYTPSFMTRFTEGVGWLTTHRSGRWWVAGVTLVVFAAAFGVTVRYSQIGESRPGVPLFWPDHPFNTAAAEIGARFGGADMLQIYADGDRDGSVGETVVIEKMERLGRALVRDSDATAVLSLAPVVRTANRLFRGADPKHEVIGQNSRGIVTFLRLNSPPGSLATIIDASGRAGAVTAFYADHRGETIDRAVRSAEEFIRANPMGTVSVRLERNRHPVLDFVYYMVGPLLPDRAHTLQVQRRIDDAYVEQPVRRTEAAGLPDWIEEFRSAAHARYDVLRDRPRPGRRFLWPDALADWENADVDQWWDDDELGLRTVALGTHLVVQDLKSKEPEPAYQPTQSWTRGVQFVLAGGVMGMLAAVNHEVERGHLANISLILAVIFLLHSVTYGSVASGAIILLQISTATLISLAYMAMIGVGLNLNTLPVQAVGVGIGVDYAIYIVDRIRQEVAKTGDVDAAIRTAVRTTGMAVTFTATTVAGGILFWTASSLRFQAEMAQLLIVLMAINMLGAIVVVPAFYSIVRPSVVKR